MSINYSNRFQNQDTVNLYETEEYGAKSYSSCIWSMQRPVIDRIVKTFRASHPGEVRLLDFACGTGRVLAELEHLVDAADGVDISENMVAVARSKCTKARLLVGDVLTQNELLQPDYDLISCFRFVLNVEPDLRVQVLRRLRQVVRQPDGLLLVNVHGNSRSLRHPAIVWRRWRGHGNTSNAMLNEMSPQETRKLLAECGFEVVRQFGFGILPPTLYRSPLRSIALSLDAKLAGDHGWNNWSIDMLFVCRPC
jgi:SAM-dependent methyltransferase